MGKKRNASASGTSISKLIHDLKTLNSDLLKEVAELRKQIEHLSSRLDSLIADGDILDSTDHDVLGLVLSSTLGEAEARSNTEIVEATYKAQSATAELKDMPEKIRKKNWTFFPIANTAVVFVSIAAVSLCKSSKLKK